MSGLIACLACWAGNVEMGLSLAMLVLFSSILHRYGHLYTVTTCRVVERKGILARRTAEADLDEIVLFNVRQGIWDRILGLGRIDMMSASDGGPDVVFGGISDPFRIKEVIWRLKAQRNRSQTTVR